MTYTTTARGLAYRGMTAAHGQVDELIALAQPLDYLGLHPLVTATPTRNRPMVNRAFWPIRRPSRSLTWVTKRSASKRANLRDVITSCAANRSGPSPIFGSTAMTLCFFV